MTVSEIAGASDQMTTSTDNSEEHAACRDLYVAQVQAALLKLLVALGAMPCRDVSLEEVAELRAAHRQRVEDANGP